MAAPLKKVDLLLEEDLVNRLNEEADARQVSLSDLVGMLLARDLNQPRNLRTVVEHIRSLRKALGPMPDSTAIIRESRDKGW